MIKIRYLLIIYICLIISIFLIPNIFIRKINYENIDDTQEKIISSNKKVNVYLTKENKNAEMNLEEYVMGVVAAEMPASYEDEALKAQAVIARTYTLNKIETKKKFGNENHPNSDVCDNINDCQAYISKEEKINNWNNSNLNGNELWNKIEKAILDTEGIIVTYNGEPIKAFFHANSGGMTENVELVWNGEPIEYLKSVETLGENNYKQYSSNVEITFEEFKDIMLEKYRDFKIDFNDKNCIEIIKRSQSNRVLKIRIGNIEMSGVDVRTMFNLKSTNFIVTILDNKIRFDVIGYGHGIGMSQTGANELAKNGYSYEDIIHHFYKDVKIEKIKQ